MYVCVYSTGPMIPENLASVRQHILYIKYNCVCVWLCVFCIYIRRYICIYVCVCVCVCVFSIGLVIAEDLANVLLADHPVYVY